MCAHAREKVWKDDNDGFLWEGADNRHNGRLSLFNLYIPISCDAFTSVHLFLNKTKTIKNKISHCPYPSRGPEGMCISTCARM